jgi:hypothetical protein
MEKNIATIPQERMPALPDKLSIEQVIEHVHLVHEVMKRVMQKNEHYGIIPGTDKPTLLKPGAEKLCLTFRLGPRYEIINASERPFRSYTVKCTLFHIPTGQFVAEGVGSCTSGEVKYRYRSETTGETVPKDYWKDRDPKHLGGTQYKPRKKDGQWLIYETVENENPEDLDNTLVKMACKRALVAATLNATAASDIFTQDLEDMAPPEKGNGDKEKKENPKEEKPKKQAKKEDPVVTLAECEKMLDGAYETDKAGQEAGEEDPGILRGVWKTIAPRAKKDLSQEEFEQLEIKKDELKKALE